MVIGDVETLTVEVPLHGDCAGEVTGAGVAGVAGVSGAGVMARAGVGVEGTEPPVAEISASKPVDSTVWSEVKTTNATFVKTTNVKGVLTDPPLSAGSTKFAATWLPPV
jgi:hypothetical protein